ncbi:FAD-dependent monooxygenase [Amycolatopsis sp. OK19-0408]|uniref:FAD-dependent monooxygenase n=1 Tax=Amycolatopsis iheyensis TaxID=2945988 RepID=A0A9X2SNS4_9PSEU|nr:FAD-dependent monooxygenase [Amycolatopsis iheyensis]MCR6487406.1 FAD-dependent monooxygenase [Amycolatopsis iheyensis]
MRDSRVAIVGGSVAGSATALALARSGCAVTVFERSRGTLADRGFGIGTARVAWREFAEAGYFDAATPVVPCSSRRWIVPDAAAGEDGRLAWEQPLDLLLTTWGNLWRGLRARVPAEVTWRTATVTGVRDTGDGVEVTADGVAGRFDVVVGADGFASLVRDVAGGGRPGYAGYALWRGTYPASRAPSLPAALRGAGVSLMIPGGHAAFYLIPGPPGGETRVNWAVYLPLPRPARRSFPPGTVGDGLVAELDRVVSAHFPASWARLVRATRREELALQPIYDLAVGHYATGRLLLAGDAGALARPHAAAGVTKAVADARALERACREHRRWDDVLTAYDAERVERGAALVELSRRLGAAQVGRTPDWTAMDAAQYRSWWWSTVDGSGR